MLNLAQFGQWDRESGRGTSQESTQQSVPTSGLRPSSQSWKHSEVQGIAWNCLELVMSAPAQTDKTVNCEKSEAVRKTVAKFL